MNAQIFAFAPGHDHQALQHRSPEPGFEPDIAALPEREWGLSAGQVAAVVAVILIVSEVMGALF